MPSTKRQRPIKDPYSKWSKDSNPGAKNVGTAGRVRQGFNATADIRGTLRDIEKRQNFKDTVQGYVDNKKKQSAIQSRANPDKAGRNKGPKTRKRK